MLSTANFYNIRFATCKIIQCSFFSLQYLGEEMDEFSGRTYHEPGTHISLPLLMLPGLVLVPGQTLPLHLFQPQVGFMFLKHIYNTVNNKYEQKY